MSQSDSSAFQQAKPGQVVVFDHIKGKVYLCSIFEWLAQQGRTT